MIHTIQIAFRYGTYSFWDMLVSAFTLCKYSHAEIIIDNQWWSSTLKEGVRETTEDTRKGKWDIYEIEVTKAIKHTAFNALYRLEGSRYDYLNLAGYVFLPTFIRNNSYVCFELVDYVLARSLRDYHDTGIKPTGRTILKKLSNLPNEIKKRKREHL